MADARIVAVGRHSTTPVSGGPFCNPTAREIGPTYPPSGAARMRRCNSALRGGRGGFGVLKLPRHDPVDPNGDFSLRGAVARDRHTAGTVGHRDLFDHREGNTLLRLQFGLFRRGKTVSVVLPQSVRGRKGQTSLTAAPPGPDPRSSASCPRCRGFKRSSRVLSVFSTAAVNDKTTCSANRSGMFGLGTETVSPCCAPLPIGPSHRANTGTGCGPYAPDVAIIPRRARIVRAFGAAQEGQGRQGHVVCPCLLKSLEVGRYPGSGWLSCWAARGRRSCWRRPQAVRGRRAGC